jgi:hypothetical protein
LTTGTLFAPPPDRRSPMFALEGGDKPGVPIRIRHKNGEFVGYVAVAEHTAHPYTVNLDLDPDLYANFQTINEVKAYLLGIGNLYDYLEANGQANDPW